MYLPTYLPTYLPSSSLQHRTQNPGSASDATYSMYSHDSDLVSSRLPCAVTIGVTIISYPRWLPSMLTQHLSGTYTNMERADSGVMRGVARSDQNSKDEILYDLLLCGKWPESATGVVSGWLVAVPHRVLTIIIWV